MRRPRRAARCGPLAHLPPPGALGQLFYKKVIATKVWGAVMGPSFFPAYCAIVLVSAAVLHHGFVENKKVQEASASVTKWIGSKL